MNPQSGAWAVDLTSPSNVAKSLAEPRVKKINPGQAAGDPVIGMSATDSTPHKDPSSAGLKQVGSAIQPAKNIDLTVAAAAGAAKAGGSVVHDAKSGSLSVTGSNHDNVVSAMQSHGFKPDASFHNETGKVTALSHPPSKGAAVVTTTAKKPGNSAVTLHSIK